MEYIELLVKLKVPDVIAITAKNSLQRRMGYSEILKDLQREDYWKIKVEIEGGFTSLSEKEKKLESLARELAEKSNIFVNPNKHIYRYIISGKKEEKDEDIKVGEYKVRVLAGFLEDSTASLVQDELKNRLGYKQIIGVERGTLWTMTLRGEDLNSAQKIAEEITKTSTRTKGLLINPHFQWYRIIKD